MFTIFLWSWTVNIPSNHRMTVTFACKCAHSAIRLLDIYQKKYDQKILNEIEDYIPQARVLLKQLKDKKAHV